MHHNALQCTAQYYTIKQHGTTLHNCDLCFDMVKKHLKNKCGKSTLGSYPELFEETKNILVPSLAVPHLNEVCNINNGPVSPCRGSSQCVIFQNCRALNTRHLGVTNGRRGRGHVTRCPPIRGGSAAHQCLRSQDPLPVIVTPAPVSRSRLLTLTRCSHLTRLLLHNAIF